MTTRAYGWLAPAPGVHRGQRTPQGSGAGLPTRVSLLTYAPPVTDQGPLGSCTGHAVAVAASIRLAMQHLEPGAPGASWFPSPLDLYLGARKREGTVDRDAGALLADVLAHAEQEGLLPDTLWPHASRGAEFRGPPPAGVDDVRGRTRIVTHEPLDWHEDTIRWEIACGFPLVIGLRTYPAFESVGPDGKIPMPDGSQSGGHAMCVLGYDDHRRALLVRNSWGDGWGLQGLGWLPMSYATNPFWCGEIHTVRTVRVQHAAELAR